MKKKTVTKVMSLLMAACMFATLTGCGSNEVDNVPSEESSKPVESSSEDNAATETSKEEIPVEDITLRIYANDAKGTDVDLVSEAVSELTQEKYGFSVEIVQFGAGEFNQKMPLALIGDEQVDIFFSSGTTFVDYARSGALYDMTDLLEEHPDLKDAVSTALWDGSAIDGRFYGVPTNKEAGNIWGFLASRKLIEENDIDVTQIKELADWEDYLALCKEEGHYGLMYPTSDWHTASAWYDDYCQLTGMFMIPSEEGNDEICYWWMTEQAEEYVLLMQDWADKGYIASDALTNNKYDVNVETFGLMGLCAGPRFDVDWVCVPMTEVRLTNGRGAMQCIAAKSEYPEQAMQFLEMWYTDPEVENLMVYGIEGKHYNLVDGFAEKVEGANTMYLMQSWKGGNMLISTPAKGNPENIWEEYQAWNDKAIVTKTATFTADTTAVAAEIAAVDAVVAEYKNLLITGMSGDPLGTLEEFRAALKEAGVDTVIAELQAQWDAK